MGTKKRRIADDNIFNDIPEKEILYSDWNIVMIGFCFNGSSWEQGSLGSGNPR